jgi:hypothetical protein
MSRQNVLLLTVFVLFALFTAAVSRAVFSHVVKPGVVAISVADYDSGSRYAFSLPAALVHAGAAFAHSAVRECDRSGSWAAAAGFLAALDRYERVTLLEIENDDALIFLEANDGRLALRIESVSARVEVDLPLRTAVRIAGAGM